MREPKADGLLTIWPCVPHKLLYAADRRLRFECHSPSSPVHEQKRQRHLGCLWDRVLARAVFSSCSLSCIAVLSVLIVAIVLLDACEVPPRGICTGEVDARIRSARGRAEGREGLSVDAGLKGVLNRA